MYRNDAIPRHVIKGKHDMTNETQNPAVETNATTNATTTTKARRVRTTKAKATKDTTKATKATGAKTFTTVDLAKEAGVNAKTLRARIRRNIDKWAPLFKDGEKHVFPDNKTTRAKVQSLMDS